MNLFSNIFLWIAIKLRNMYKEEMISIYNYLEIVEVVENGASSFVVR